MARALGALLTLVLWLCLNLLSASPDLHRLVHGNSHQTSHECALTLLSKGLVTGADLSDSEVNAPDQGECSSGGHQQEIFQASDVRLAPGRAPPELVHLRETLC